LLFTEAIPTLVALELEQYEAFLQGIGNVSIDIDSENLTINADLQELERLQQETIVEIRAMKLILDADILSAIQDLNAAIGLQTTVFGRDIRELRESNEKDFLMINKTLTDLYDLERAEVAAIANEFFSKLTEINNVLGTINAFADSISTVISVVNTFLSSTQAGLLGDQVTQQTQTNTLLQEFVNVFDQKVIDAVASSPWEVNTANLDGTDLFFDACIVDDPEFGIGPIQCEGLQTTGLIQNGVTLEPVMFVKTTPELENEVQATNNGC